MGEVYQARDARLDRMVAIKILPSHLAGNTQFRQRFEREARTLASLSHPHICPVHDVGSIDGTDYLVMEFLDGETLADRLRAGRMPLDKTLKTAIEIADALDGAERAGIVHRDVKPGNIMLTKSGAKLVDFGLAKPGPAMASAPDPVASTLPTEAPDLTVEGSILGTVQYMAPEQLEGREADARSDIFALGAVLYEMIAGRRAFAGDTRASVMSAILRDAPPPIAATLPANQKVLGAAGIHHLDHTVRRCLAKDPDERWQSARDVMLQLQWIAEGGPDRASITAAARPARAMASAAWFAAGVVLASALAAGWWISKSAPSAAGLLRFSIDAPPEAVFAPTNSVSAPHPVVSPDGRRRADSHLGAAARRRGGAAAFGDRGRGIPILVGRQPHAGLLRRGSVEDDRPGRRSCASCVRCTVRRRRNLEPRQHHPVRAGSWRGSPACVVFRRRPDCVGDGCSCARTCVTPVAGVFPRRPALSVSRGRCYFARLTRLVRRARAREGRFAGSLQRGTLAVRSWHDIAGAVL
jgi:hypothetical protein